MEHHNNFIIKHNLATPIAILISGILIAAAIFFGGRIGSTNSAANVGNNAAAQAPSAGAPTAGQAVDVSKVQTSGNPFIGSANAPVTMALWTDYQCPFCKQFEANDVDQAIKDYVNSGKLRIVFKDFQFLGPDSETTAVIARAIWDADPSQFYTWRDSIYKNQGQEGSGWATQDKIYAMTTNILGASVTAQVKALVASKGSVYQKEIDADKAEGGSFGIQGTPGAIIGKTFINGAQPYSTVKAAIDQALAGK